jgi:hypothetical protein
MRIVTNQPVALLSHALQGEGVPYYLLREIAWLKVFP